MATHTALETRNSGKERYESWSHVLCFPVKNKVIHGKMVLPPELSERNIVMAAVFRQLLKWFSSVIQDPFLLGMYMLGM